MPYSNKQMLRDANGDLIPQYWDVVEQEFKPLTGRDGANDVRITGSIVEREVANNLLVTAGTRVFARTFTFNDISDFASYIVLARAETAHNYRISADFATIFPSHVADFRKSEFYDSGGSVIIGSEPRNISGSILRVYITNNDTSDHRYSVSLLFRRVGA